ncbi:ammonia monooxygenase [Fretibacterium sp. OH1220_COT-178]|nr:ammonia monooxygenase [Fretibacterium sp. OH1220_COT-178]
MWGDGLLQGRARHVFSWKGVLNVRESIVIAASVLLGGGVGHLLRLPSGVLVGGMVAGLLVKGVTLGDLPGGNLLSVASQLLVAYVIVSNSDVASLRAHPEAVPAALFYIVLLLAFCIGMAFAVVRFFGIDLRTAVYATAPGALSGMALSATDAGAETPVSLIFHLFRMVIVLIVTPLAALFLTR